VHREIKEDRKKANQEPRSSDATSAGMCAPENPSQKVCERVRTRLLGYAMPLVGGTLIRRFQVIHLRQIERPASVGKDPEVMLHGPFRVFSQDSLLAV
jgi:hypothetical protein